MYGPELFPDVELVLTGFLRSALAARPEAYCSGVHVSNSLPNPRPTRAVVVRRDGGRRTTHVTETAYVGLNVWAGDEQDAADLSRMTAALLHTLAPPPVVHVETQSAFSSIPDPSGQPRRFGTFEVVLTSTPLPPAA